jgi:tetratricopeptide (TPR) repeat protein
MRLCALALVGVVALSTSAFGDELDALAQAIDTNPDDPKAYDAYAMAAFKLKRFDDAIRKLKLGVARISDYPEGYYKLAYAYRQKQEWADAADYYRRYITVNPKKTDPYFGLGIALKGVGDKKGAVAAFEKYVSLETSPAKQKFIDQAKAELATLNPTGKAAPETVAPGPRADANALRGEADKLRKDGKMVDAAAAYERAIEADRGNVELYVELGRVYTVLKRYDDAVRTLSAALERDPQNAMAVYGLAHAFRKQDHFDKAIASYRKYSAMRPDDPDPYYGLGQACKGMGDSSGAIQAFRHYIEMERRPEEQKWVEKARTELQSLEGGGSSLERRSGPLADEPGALQRANARLERELALESAIHDDDALVDPFASVPFRAARFGLDDGLVDPFGPVTIRPALRAGANPQLGEYGAALLAYRRALVRHVEEVSLALERGMEFVLADNATEAARLWNETPLSDSRVDLAKRAVEGTRTQFARGVVTAARRKSR